MPDQALLGMPGNYAFYDPIGAFVLLVPGDDLPATLVVICGVSREVREQIEDNLRSEHGGDGGVDLLQGGRFGVSVDAPGSPQLHWKPDRAIAKLLALGRH